MAGSGAFWSCHFSHSTCAGRGAGNGTRGDQDTAEAEHGRHGSPRKCQLDALLDISMFYHLFTLFQLL